MSTKAKEPSESDVIVARALRSYAQLRASIASWGGLPTTSSPAHDQDDEEIFTTESETVGVGYVAPEDSDVAARQVKASTDKLRKQMLGKRGRDTPRRLERVCGTHRAPLSQKAARRNAIDYEDSDEDAGRSAMGKKKRHAAVELNFSATTEEEVKISGLAIPAPAHERSEVEKRPGSYLDELLAERSKKRKRKKIKDKDKYTKDT